MSGSGAHKRPKLRRLRRVAAWFGARDQIDLLTLLVCLLLLLDAVTLAGVIRLLSIIGAAP